MNAKYNEFNRVRCIEFGSLERSGSRDGTTIELAQTAIKETIKTMFPDSAAPASNDTSTADANPEHTEMPSTEQSPSTPPRTVAGNQFLHLAAAGTSRENNSADA
jgi:hypothetical protein